VCLGGIHYYPKKTTKEHRQKNGITIPRHLTTPINEKTAEKKTSPMNGHWRKKMRPVNSQKVRRRKDIMGGNPSAKLGHGYKKDGDKRRQKKPQKKKEKKKKKGGNAVDNGSLGAAKEKTTQGFTADKRRNRMAT